MIYELKYRIGISISLFIMRYRILRKKKKFLPSFWVDENLGRTLTGIEKYEYLLDSFKKNGWDIKQPLCIRISKENIKVSNGHHRLFIAKELGIKLIPVCLIYK